MWPQVVQIWYCCTTHFYHPCASLSYKMLQFILCIFSAFSSTVRVLFQIDCSRAQATVWRVSWKLVGIAIKRVYTFDQNFCPSKTDYFTGVSQHWKMQYTDVIADVQLTLPQRKLWVCLKYLKPQTSANPVNNCSLHIHIELFKLIRNCRICYFEVQYASVNVGNCVDLSNTRTNVKHIQLVHQTFTLAYTWRWFLNQLANTTFSSNAKKKESQILWFLKHFIF